MTNLLIRFLMWKWRCWKAWRDVVCWLYWHGDVIYSVLFYRWLWLEQLYASMRMEYIEFKIMVLRTPRGAMMEED